MSCEVPKEDTSITSKEFVGGSGFKHENYTLTSEYLNSETTAEYIKKKLDDNSIDTKKALVKSSTTTKLDLEEPINYYDNFASKYSGFFLAPKAGKYKFYVAGDDSVAVYLSLTANSADRTKLGDPLLSYTHSGGDYRDFYRDSAK